MTLHFFSRYVALFLIRIKKIHFVFVKWLKSAVTPRAAETHSVFLTVGVDVSLHCHCKLTKSFIKLGLVRLCARKIKCTNAHWQT